MEVSAEATEAIFGCVLSAEGDMAKCPHCKQPVTLEKTRREGGDLPDGVHKDVVGLMKKEIMYSCPHCDAVLGFGFFVGGLLTGRP